MTFIDSQLTNIFQAACDSEARVGLARAKLAAGVYDNNPRIARITAERLQADLLDHDFDNVDERLNLDAHGWDS